ncbi:MAG: ABC transporter ATP-binding protein [Paracoccaceae bacterium]
MAEDTTVTLEVKGLSGGYGKVPILHGIDFTVAEGEVVGILGHNGMGKTTLLKTLMGFLPATSGSVRFHSTDIARMAPYERAGLGLGYVPQGRGIFPQLSVRDNLRFAWHDYSGASERDVMEAVLADFPRLRVLLDRDGGALSGGEQQLLALARCLMGDPDFLLLDEPTEGIQPSIIEEMAETLLKLRKARGLSVLLVEQNFDFIADLSGPGAGAGTRQDHRRAEPRRPGRSGQGGPVPGLRSGALDPWWGAGRRAARRHQGARYGTPTGRRIACAPGAVALYLCRGARARRPQFRLDFTGDQHDDQTPLAFADAPDGAAVRDEPVRRGSGRVPDPDGAELPVL